MTFFLIQIQILVFAPLKYCPQVMQALFKTGSIHCKIIHKDLHNFFCYIKKYTHHASLESTRSITQTKWHAPKSKCTKWVCKSGFLLILWCNSNFVISRVSIKKTKMRVSHQPIQHLINGRQGKMIISGCSIQLSVVNTHPPSCHSFCRNKFILFISDHIESTFLGNHMHWAYPRTI